MNHDRLLADALRELQQKTREQIEEETAYKWAARTVAAFRLYDETQDSNWLTEASEYIHEAIEHAALADETGEVLRSVRSWVRQHSRSAI